MKRALALTFLLVSCATPKSDVKAAKEAVAEGAAAAPVRNCDEEVLDAKAACAAKASKVEEDLAACKAQLSKCSLAAPAAKAPAAKAAAPKAAKPKK